MKIVIKIPNFEWLENEGDFKEAVKEYEQGTKFDKEIRNALLNGTPLPEHHGRLIDADALQTEMEKDVRKAMSFVDLKDFVWLAPTIIEGSERR